MTGCWPWRIGKWVAPQLLLRNQLPLYFYYLFLPSCYDFGSSSSPSYGQMELKASLCTNQRNMEQTLVVDEQQQMLFQLDSYVRSYEPNGLYETSRNIFIVLAAIMQLPLFATVSRNAASYDFCLIRMAFPSTFHPCLFCC
jgi:hypothetical protein